jgi:sugar/nucleoside kinase (ribokinase family)
MPAGRAPTILCAGIAVIDYVFALAEFPVPGTKTRANDFVVSGGGCAANAAVAIARLGGTARLAAPLGGPAGADTVGDEILARLARAGIDCSGAVRIDGAQSPLSAIFIDTSGERLIVNHRDDRLSEAQAASPDALVADIDALLIDNRFSDFVLPIAQAARRRAIPVVLDGDEPTRRSEELLPVCSHVVFSAEGLRATAACEDLATALQRVGVRTDAFVAVTDGANGMLWLEDHEPRRLPAFAVKAADTLAAGDAFHGAFVLALAEGQAIADAMHFAAAAAAIKCTRFGGIAGAPTRAEVERFLAERA